VTRTHDLPHGKESARGVDAAQHANVDAELVTRAFRFAAAAHEGQHRRSGEPFITHPVGVASICAGLRLDEQTIAAALLHDVVEDTEIELDALREEFGDEIVEFLCECADPACAAPLSIPVSLYEAVRSHPRWFLVVPGHQREVERVVQEHPGCLVIEKLGEAGEVAEDTDPRP